MTEERDWCLVPDCDVTARGASVDDGVGCVRHNDSPGSGCSQALADSGCDTWEEYRGER